MGTVQPPVVKHRITESGVTTLGQTYVWSDLRGFYFSHVSGYTVLSIQSPLRSHKLNLVLQGVDKDKVKEKLSKFLSHYEEPPKSFLGMLTEKVGHLLNLS